MEATGFGANEVGSHGKTWSLDRRVPIALVITTVVQLLAFAWFANGPFAHPDDQDRRAIAFGAEASKAGREGIGIAATLSRIDRTLDILLASLIRIEGLLKRHPDDGR